MAASMLVVLAAAGLVAGAPAQNTQIRSAAAIPAAGKTQLANVVVKRNLGAACKVAPKSKAAAARCAKGDSLAAAAAGAAPGLGAAGAGAGAGTTATIVGVGIGAAGAIGGAVAGISNNSTSNPTTISAR